MRTLAGLVPGNDLVLGGQLGIARVGPTRRPVLRLMTLDPATHTPIYADLEDVPPTEMFALPLDGGIDGDDRPTYLIPHPAWEADHRREIRDFAVALRRWRAERRAAGQ